MHQKYAEILGVRISSTSRSQVLEYVSFSLKESRRFLITTPNPEIVLAAQKDKLLMKVLNSSDLALPDGIGLVYAGRFLGLSVPKKVLRGREMFVDLCKAAYKNNWRVYLIGGESGTTRLAAEKLQEIIGKMKVGYSDGPVLSKGGKPIDEKQRKVERENIDNINTFKPDVLFVGFGCPKQEKWLYYNFKKLKAGGAMVVGGSFDSFTGKVVPPPGWISDMGLEWLWRLVLDPLRIGRIINATIIFPFRVLTARLASK